MLLTARGGRGLVPGAVLRLQARVVPTEEEQAVMAVEVLVMHMLKR